MKQITSNTWRLDSIDELRPRCKNSDKGKKKYRFHCPLCGDESKHSRRTDGAFDEDKGVGHCFCCGANFFASKWAYTPKHQPMLQKPEISLGSYPSSVMAYLKERGLKPEVMHHLGVGYAELPADTPDGKKIFLAFRFMEQGEVVNVQYKSPDKDFRFEPGRLMVISGYPGAGKSSFADYIMMSLAVQQGWKAAVYSPEKYPMSLHYYELGQILMGREMSAKNFTDQAISRALCFLTNNIFHITDESNSIEDIITSATLLVRQKGIRVLVIDPFNYIELPVLSGANDTQKISYVLKRMVDFAHEEKVLVILVAHPKKPQTDGTRKQEPQMPSLYDIAGSADFYTFANCILANSIRLILWGSAWGAGVWFSGK